MSLGYAWEKMFNAVYGAASSEEPLQQRLATAYMYHVMYVHKADVPAEIWERVDALGKAVNSKPAVGSEGTIAATTSQMSTEEASKWLEEIVSIFNSVAEEYYKSP